MEIEVPHDELNLIAQGFSKLLNEPSERSAIIILSARIESLTENACSHLLPGIAFASHQRRIEGLRGMGVLDDKVFQILGELADLRNYYAHTYEDCFLSDKKIDSKVRNMLGIGNSAFGSEMLHQKMNSHLLAQLPAAERNVQAGRFSSDLNHLLVIFSQLAVYLLALAHIRVIRSPTLDVQRFTIKSV
jgi:hypothetical protein